MVSKRTPTDSRTGQLVRACTQRGYPAKKGASGLQGSKEPSVPTVRAGEGHGFLSFRYAFKEVSLSGGKTHIRSKEQRFEDGKFQSEEFEGTTDARVYQDAVEQTRDIVAGQVGSVLGLFSALLPFSSRPKGK